MTTITFLFEAEGEMNFSAQYYNQQAPGLGFDFLEEIERSLKLIVESPERWAASKENIRKYNVRRFPFSIYYAYEKDEDKVLIIAVAHQKRKPEYWKGRI